MANAMQSVVKELTKVNAAATVDLQTIPSNRRPGMAVAKQDAERRLAAIKTEYKAMLKDRAFTVFCFGDESQQAAFAKIAKEEGEDAVVVVDAQELYQRMALAVEPALGAQRQFGGTVLGHLIREIEDVARETGTGKLIQVPRLRDVAITRTPKEVADTCREIVLQDTGHDLNKDYLEHLTFLRAFEQGTCGNHVIVIVLNARLDDDQLQENMFTGEGIAVEMPAISEAVTKEFVLFTFKRISEAYKAKKQ